MKQNPYRWAKSVQLRVRHAAAAAQSPSVKCELCKTYGKQPWFSPSLQVLQARTLNWVCPSSSPMHEGKGKWKFKLSQCATLSVIDYSYQAHGHIGFTGRTRWEVYMQLPVLLLWLANLTFLALLNFRNCFQRIPCFRQESEAEWDGVRYVWPTLVNRDHIKWILHKGSGK